ncbi:hypothetical protein C0J52_19381 [Blattella germanica]|nr:hypothetical protein C0J52_19381 [Blattella germanica]
MAAKVFGDVSQCYDSQFHFVLTGVCDLNEKIYCVGGWNGQVGIKQCDVLDPETGSWSPIASLQTGRYQAGVCSMDGQVFAAGGCDAWNCLSSVEVYDPITDSWTYAKGMITARRGCGLAYFNEIYDPKEKTWTPGPNMTTSRANVGVAVIGSRLYAVGGFSGKTFLNSIEYLDEKTNEWTTFVPKYHSEDGNGDILDLRETVNGIDEACQRLEEAS